VRLLSQPPWRAMAAERARLKLFREPSFIGELDPGL
jgi:hypothetical protein